MSVSSLFSHAFLACVHGEIIFVCAKESCNFQLCRFSALIDPSKRKNLIVSVESCNNASFNKSIVYCNGCKGVLGKFTRSGNVMLYLEATRPARVLILGSCFYYEPLLHSEIAV